MCYSPWDSKVGHILAAELEDETKGWAAKGPMANFQDGRNILYLDHNNAYIIIYACQSIKLLTKKDAIISEGHGALESRILSFNSKTT